MTEIALDAPESAPDAAPTYRSVLNHQPVRIVALSRFLSRMAGQIMSYGIMVFLAVAGASQLEISVAKSAAFVAALLFGLQGGMLADSRPKRQILLVGFVALASVCFLTPFLLGTSSGDLLFVIFVASAINQVVGPGLKSIVAIVSSPAELATTSALVNIVGSIGSSVGSTLIAPVLIKQSGIEAILIATGILYLLSAVRIYRLPSAEEMGKPRNDQKTELARLEAARALAALQRQLDHGEPAGGLDDLVGRALRLAAAGDYGPDSALRARCARFRSHQ